MAQRYKRPAVNLADEALRPSIGVASDAGGPADAGAAAPPSKRLRTQTGAAAASAAMTEERRTSSSGMQGGVGKLHSCIVKVRFMRPKYCAQKATQRDMSDDMPNASSSRETSTKTSITYLTCTSYLCPIR